MTKMYLKLTLTSFYSKYITFFSFLLKKYLKSFNIIGPIFNPVKIKRFCVLRAPSRHNDSRDQLELRLYKSTFFVKINTKQNFIVFFTILYNQLTTLSYTNIKFKLTKL